jgi:galactose mutarotase-like enzyme
MEPVPYRGETLRPWRVGSSTFLALPERGARLMNWNLTLGDGSVRDVIHWPEEADLTAIAKVRGGNPILFPFPARTFDRGEINAWRGPDGVRRPMPMHGLARQGAFKLTRMDDRGFTARFEPGDEARAAYPFDYDFQVRYRFERLALACEFTLENLGREPIPWSAGHHFYFTVPWSDGTARADYRIRIPATRWLRQDGAGQLVAAPPLKTDESLANSALVDTFHTGLRSNEAILGLPGEPGNIVIRLDPGIPPPADATFVTWTVAPDSPFYCVEPWMGPPNAPETKAGLHWVQPGKLQRFAVEVAVRPG